MNSVRSGYASSSHRQLLLVLATLTCVPAGEAAAFTNGSLNGPTNTHSLVPSSWTNYNSGTSDTVSTAGHPFAASFGGIASVPYAASANGGTFVWSSDFSGAAASSTPEGLVQTVGGLTAGQQYTISFEYTNLSLYSAPNVIATAAFGIQNYNSTGRWLVLANNVNIGSTPAAAPSALSGQQTWLGYQTIFTATSSSATFAFAADWVSGAGTHVGMGIDGIAISAVPDLPPSLSLLSGLLALRLWRRPVCR